MTTKKIEREQHRQYLQRWQTLGPLLDGLRFWELREISDEEHVRSLTSLLSGSVRRIDNDAAGWIAWQKVRERWMKRS